MDVVQITLDKTAHFFRETFPYGPSQRKLRSDFGRFQERKMCFVAICSTGQPFSWTGVGVRWIKAGIFTIDVAQIWQDFQQSPNLRLLGIWYNLGNIKVSLSLHKSPKNCNIPSQIIAETFSWTRYKKKCRRITSHISGILGTALPGWWSNIAKGTMDPRVEFWLPK